MAADWSVRITAAVTHLAKSGIFFVTPTPRTGL